jgi:aspartate/methionine/tyrosine aminotransferase
VRANYRQLRQAVASTPSCSVLCAAGGWYGVIQVPTFESEEGLVLRLLTSQAVLAHPGYFFDFPRESFLIVSLLTPEDTFHEGIGRILREIERP